ncbi:hypothetical protein ACJQWK_03688 [Exserohilum turcicum]|uniref:Carbonic anhydrase n=1 Tax=Exserohilum turcicum (strain 28A) TaxID=671987 RepID=R0KRJ4_EXST2|nr:uncharacterized protein SETTUDRAFT_40627 [Exserohilum turcica Et28A]EOA91614.1 hypothetical protein SETTUDRAFT_40627 [Exserohilum turcica Et28A]
MSNSGTLVVIACSEPDPRVDPACHFNLTSNTTRVIKTAGGRTEGAISSIQETGQSTKIEMIVVVQHTGCAWSPGEVESNIRCDIQSLKASPIIQKDIPIIGYLLDLATGQSREINVPRTGPDAEARQRVLSQMEDFAPFWS